MSFKAEVQTVGDDHWSSNRLRFATEHEAGQYVGGLADRWTSVTATRVVPSEDDINCRIVANRMQDWDEATQAWKGTR